MKERLEKAGIKVVNGKIAKADVGKAMKVISAAKWEDKLKKLLAEAKEIDPKISKIFLEKDYDYGVFSDVSLVYKDGKKLDVYDTDETDAVGLTKLAEKIQKIVEKQGSQIYGDVDEEHTIK